MVDKILAYWVCGAVLGTRKEGGNKD